MHHRFTTCLVLALTAGCADGQIGDAPGGDAGAPSTDPPPPAPDGGSGPDPDGPDGPGWSLDVDTSSTSSFAAGMPESWPVSGQATASLGLDRVEVNGSAVSTGSDGSFETMVPVEPGVQLVEITAHDNGSPAHSRDAHRSIIASEMLPEGELNPGAAALTLDDSIVGPMADALSGRVADLDIASEILARDKLTDDECVTYPTAARHGEASLSLRVVEGQLVLEIVVPDLHIELEGTCSNFLLGSTDVTGTIDTDVVIRTTLSAPPGETCIERLEHTAPAVEMRGFDQDVEGGSGLFESLLISLGAELKEGDSADRMKEEFAAQADELLAGELEGIEVFDSSETMTLFERDVDVELCATGLASDAGQLVADVGARAVGPGGTEAPGAPFLPGMLPPAAPKTLWLDSNLVGQLLYSAWRAGALDSEDVDEVTVGLLAVVAPELGDRYSNDTPVSVSIEGKLPPLARAAPVPEGEGERGDLALDIGELHLLLEAEGELLFRLGTQLTLVLELVPEDGELRPELVRTDATAWVVDEPIVDGEDDVLAEVVAGKVGDAASGLLDDTTIALPELGGTLVPTDATATDGGRYVAISLE